MASCAGLLELIILTTKENHAHGTQQARIGKMRSGHPNRFIAQLDKPSI
jgi:hypothetical protein